MKMDKRPWILSAQFLKAIEEKNFNLVNSILDAGFDMDINLMFCKNAINICVSNGWYEMAQLLIHRGCSLSLGNDLGQAPLTIAVLQSDYRVVKLLLENRADGTRMDSQGKSALHYACELNNFKIIELLTENARPKHVNIRGHNRMTPLSYACEHGSAAAVYHLLSKGADVNNIDYLCSTPLFNAIHNVHCSPEMVALLLNAGADVNHLNHFSETVLLCALRIFSKRFARAKYKADARFQAICLLLIEHGCNVNIKNFHRETALHLAVHLDDAVLVRKLLNAGCETDTKNELDLVPLFYACQNGAPRIVSLLLEAGADPRCVSDAHPWTWYSRGESGKYVFRILQQSKGCQTLSSACRHTIRKALSPNIEKRVHRLPLPPFIKNYLLLAD